MNPSEQHWVSLPPHVSLFFLTMWSTLSMFMILSFTLLWMLTLMKAKCCCKVKEWMWKTKMKLLGFLEFVFTDTLVSIVKVWDGESLLIKTTPAEPAPLGSKGPQEGLNCSSVTGMVHYLQHHTYHGITFAVSSCRQYIHTKKSHEITLLSISQNLWATMSPGLEMTANRELNTEILLVGGVSNIHKTLLQARVKLVIL